MTSKTSLSEQEQYELYSKLCHACKRSDIREVERLLDLGVYAYNEQWEKEHRYNCLSELLLFGKDLASKNFKYIFKRLCAAGANPHHYNYDSGSLLTNTIMHGHSEEIVAWLIDEIELDVNGRNCYGETPLFSALRSSHDNNVEIIKLLLDRGANPLLRNKYNKLPYDIAPEHLKALLPIPKPVISQTEAWRKAAPVKSKSGWLAFFQDLMNRDRPKPVEQNSIQHQAKR